LALGARTDDWASDVIFLFGLRGVGKSTWIRRTEDGIDVWPVPMLLEALEGGAFWP
jgi:hypothetical protein